MKLYKLQIIFLALITFASCHASPIEQLKQQLLNLDANGNFQNLKIKKVSHPLKFVDTWSGWKDMWGAKITLNADGTCKVDIANYDKGKTRDIGCQYWYHITLKNQNFLLFVYPTHYNLTNYEWADENNLYFSFYNNYGGYLASRINKIEEARNISQRWFLGSWLKKQKNYNIFWIFGVNNQFKIQMYDKKSSKLLINKDGKWSINGKKLTISDIKTTNLKQFSLNEIEEVNPKKEYSLTLNTPNTLSANPINMQRFSEPILIKDDPFIGKFQSYQISTNHTNITDAKTLIISKKSDTKYNVNFYWNNKHYKNITTTKKNDTLHIPINKKILYFKPTTSGITEVSATDKTFIKNGKLIRVSQKTTLPQKTLIGRWTQKHDSSGEMRHFTFLEDGRYFQSVTSAIARIGTYRQEKDRIYFKPNSTCSKEGYYSVSINESHMSINSLKSTFVKIDDSQIISSFWDAFQSLKISQKKIELKPHPKYKGKFLFITNEVYSYSFDGNSVSFKLQLTPSTLSLNSQLSISLFYPLGGSYVDISSYTYYVDVSKEGEYIILLRSGKIAFKLPLKNNRLTVCYDNREALLK